MNDDPWIPWVAGFMSGLGVGIPLALLLSAW